MTGDIKSAIMRLQMSYYSRRIYCIYCNATANGEQDMKKDDTALEFKDLSFDEQELLHRYRTNIIFQAQVDRIIYERLGSDALDEAMRIDKANRKRMNDKEV